MNCSNVLVLNESGPLYIKLTEQIIGCTGCHLHTSGGHRDLGEGIIPSSLMFVGEAYGKSESEQSRPFIGKAGQLLRSVLTKNKICMSKSEDLEWISGFLCNTICCWPPPLDSHSDNSKPTKESIQACKRHLWEKIKLVKPQVIVPLGDVATRNLLAIPDDAKKDDGSYLRITDMVGKVESKDWSIGHVKILPMFHPSYVLRQGSPKLLMELYDKILDKIRNYLISGKF